MTIFLRCPSTFESERKWISSHILSLLTDDYEIYFENRDDWEISISNPNNRSGVYKFIRLSDAFFRIAQNSWLKKESLPKLPLSSWIVDLEGSVPLLVEQFVPILYGQPGYIKDSLGNIFLNLDVFGSAFFMLSRYEEFVEPKFDKHGRFLGETSIAFLAGFIERPLIDEYCEILWAAIFHMWPFLIRKPAKSRNIISCDLDHPFVPQLNIHQIILNLRGGLIEPIQSFSKIRKIWCDKKNKNHIDPNYEATLWMMSENEKRGNRVTFYVVADNVLPKFDGQFNIRDKRIRSLLREIHHRGHEIGIHPSYTSFDNEQQINLEIDALRKVMEEEGISQRLVSSRQHYLRWNPSVTPVILNNKCINYDSSLSDPFRAGFRCGTSKEFSIFDVKSGFALEIKERPLVLMESSVIARRYMNLGYGENSLLTMKRIKSRCHMFGGIFTLLWHNSHLRTVKDMDFYLELIS